MEITEFKVCSERIVSSISSVFVGDMLVAKKVLCAALANGHVLFEDNPGLGKTLLARTFAQVTGCDWGRVQFTPDLMPADILGTRVWKSRTSEFAMEKGPIFTNIVLADEINRSPPKTQAALLEAMEERQATIEGVTYELPRPFFVLATQNPIEHEGTFRLPEAQLDRFLLKMSTGYVSTLEQESEILRRRIRWGSNSPGEMVKPALTRESFLEMQEVLEKRIYVDDKILDYISEIVRGTREHSAVEVGASPRGGIALLKLARGLAAMAGRDFVTPDDIKTFAREALGHRIILAMEFEVQGRFTPESVIDQVLASVKIPTSMDANV
jgi:MoxR-like ATPase